MSLSPKLIFFVIITLVSAYLAGYYSADLSSTLEFLITYQNFIQAFSLFLISIIIFAILITFFFAITTDNKLITASIIIFAIIFTLAVHMNIGVEYDPLFLIVNFSLIALGFFVAQRKVEDVYGNSIHANLSRSTHEAGKSLFLVLAILISFNYYTLNSNIDYTDEIIDGIIERAITPVAYFAERNISNQLEEQINEQLEQTKQLGTAQAKDIANQLNAQISSTLQLDETVVFIDESDIDVEIDEQEIKIEGLENAVKPIIKERINETVEPYSHLVAPILAIALYLTLVPILTLCAYLLYPISFIVVRILKALGFIKEETETVEITRLRV